LAAAARQPSLKKVSDLRRTGSADWLDKPLMTSPTDRTALDDDGRSVEYPTSLEARPYRQRDELVERLSPGGSWMPK
jgi:hypothetical protein